MKKFKTLDKGWKEIVFAMSAFGPNLLMGIMGAYYRNFNIKLKVNNSLYDCICNGNIYSPYQILDYYQFVCSF